MEFEGIEYVDAQQRERQRALTTALWSLLEEKGIKEGDAGRIECYFFAPGEAESAALRAAFQDWDSETTEYRDAQKRVWLHTPQVRLSKAAFLDLVDVVMIAAEENACVFDGFQVKISDVVKRRWWKFW